MKYNIDKYPIGSFKGQKSPGKYMDKYLHDALRGYASKISQDMTFFGVIFSSTLEVGTGKSVLATQIGEAWTEIVNKEYNLDIPYSVNNIVWRPKDLIERSFKIPKYSCIILDEWEDSHYWSELGVTLRQFFRKCRQLNLFMIAIIPNFFQLPLSYAVSRTAFAIDVKFDDNLNRGFFDFYNFPAKKWLYIKGKKTHNYKATRRTFPGRFVDGYGVDEVEYRKKKYEDMLKYDEDNPQKKTKAQIEKDKMIEVVQKIIRNKPEISTRELAIMLGVSDKSIIRYKQGGVGEETNPADNYIYKLIKEDKPHEIEVDEEVLEKEDEKKQSPIDIDKHDETSEEVQGEVKLQEEG